MELLTSELEGKFVDRFLPIDREAARALLEALKRVSSRLPVRLEAANVGAVGTRTFPRVHGVFALGSEPILWSMCAPRNAPPKSRSHQKVEVLLRQEKTLRAGGVLRDLEQIARPAGIRFGDAKGSPVLRIGITSGISREHAVRIADAVAKIAVLVMPLYG